MARSKTKYVFVTGGVMSSVGKGVSTASIALLLKKRGYKVTAVKYEGYLNIDAGTINPIEHGDPFLCADGTEADMDLGTYERYLGQEMKTHNFYTFGRVLKSVLDKERSMYYGGDDVEPIPHVRDEIIEEIMEAGKKDGADVVFTELGGTVGEPTNSMNAIYYEAIRKMKSMYPNDVVHIHVGYILFPKHLGEPKTKPIQISVRLLMANGIMPDFLIVRGNKGLDKRRKELLARFSDLDTKHTIAAPDIDNIYKIPIEFYKQKVDETLINDLGLKEKKLSLDKLKADLAFLYEKPSQQIKLSIVGKYFATGEHQLLDSYFALIESIKHSAWKQNIEIEFNYVNSEVLEQAKDPGEILAGSNAIIVPIGWGNRGVDGKLLAIKYARENKIPYLGLCYGMQLAAVEFARNVVGLKDAHTEEVQENCKHKIIHSIPFNPEYQVIKGEGVSMRLGAFDCVVKKGTVVEEAYKKHNQISKKNVVVERHRHRYEFNNAYRKQLEEAGLVFSGTSPDDFFVEFLELPTSEHPFFVATQAHPEYKSTPWVPHPLFMELLEAGVTHKKANQ